MSFARRMARQWRWWAALAAAATVVPLVPRRPGGPADVAAWTRAIERIEATVPHDPAAAEERAAALRPRVAGDLRTRLAIARARARLRLFQTRDAASAEAVRELRRELDGLGTEEARALLLELGVVARDSELVAESLDILDGLGPEGMRELAVALKRRPGPDFTKLAPFLKREAEERPDEYRFLQARLEREEKGPEAALAAVPEALANRPDVSLFRARCLLALGRFPECVDAARRAGEPGLYFDAEARRRIGDPSAEEAAVILLRGTTPIAPAGHLVLGRKLLAGHDPAGWLHLLEALPSLRSPWLRAEIQLDPGALYPELRGHALAETDPDRMRLAATALDLWPRLFPSDIGAHLDAAVLAVQRAKTERDPDHAREARRDAARIYRRFAELMTAGASGRAGALRHAAEQLFEAGDYLDAAAIHRGLHEEDPRAQRQALFREGVCLARAGQLRDALARLSRYVDSVPRGDALVPAAHLERARLLASMGDLAALEEIDRIFAPGTAAGPRSAEWREALRLKAGLLLRRGETEAARRALAEFVERYGPEDSGAPRAEVASARALLAVLRMQEGAYEEAAALLDRARLEARTDPAGSPHDEVRVTGLLLGDAYLALGRYLEARQSYDVPVRTVAEPPWKVIALVGRARASLGLREVDEARRDFREAERLLRESRATDPIARAAVEALRREMP